MEPPAALRQPDFRSLWLAGLISDGGDWMLLVALPIVVYGLTGSALGTSLAFLAELGPGVVLAPLAGRLADRVDRRCLMLSVALLQAFSLLPLLFIHGRSGLALVYAVIVIEAGLSTLFDPAKNALLPTLLARDELVSGNSLIALNSGVGRLAGGPLGGLLLAAGDLRTIVVADAVSFLVAGWLIARLPGAPRRTVCPGLGGSARAASSPAARAGFLVVLRGRPVRMGLLVAFVAEIAQGIFVVLFILFVARRLHGGFGEIGLLRGVQAVGAIGAGMRLSFAARGRSAAELIAAGAIAFGLLDLTVWNAPLLTTATAVYVGLFIVVGAPGVVMQTGLISFLALAGAEGERGRIFGAFSFVSNAGQAVGMLVAGLLTAPLGLMELLNVQGSLYLAAGTLAALTLVRRPKRDRSPATGVGLADGSSRSQA